MTSTPIVFDGIADTEASAVRHEGNLFRASLRRCDDLRSQSAVLFTGKAWYFTFIELVVEPIRRVVHAGRLIALKLPAISLRKPGGPRLPANIALQFNFPTIASSHVLLLKLGFGGRISPDIEILR